MNGAQTQTCLSSLHGRGPYQENPGRVSEVAHSAHKSLLWNAGRCHKCSECLASLLQGQPYPQVFPICYHYDATVNWGQAKVYVRSKKFSWLPLRVLRTVPDCVHLCFVPPPILQSSILGIFCFLSFLSLCDLGLADSQMQRSRLPGLAILF